jgi:hypothetical protein
MSTRCNSPDGASTRLIIQDGNYGDFELGEHAFAVEFTPIEVGPLARTRQLVDVSSCIFSPRNV